MRWTDACGAPGSAAAWISNMLDAVPWPCRPALREELAQLAIPPSRGPNWEWCPPTADPLVTRIARSRYRFLAAHFQPGVTTTITHDGPDTPELALLWEKVVRADEEVVRRRRQLERAEWKAARAFADYALAWAAIETGPGGDKPLPRKRGAKGSPHFREAVRAALRLYRDVFGRPPSRSHNGPTWRWVSAFFAQTERTWFWIDTERFEPRYAYVRTRTYNERLAPVRPPRALPDVIRHALDAERNEYPGERWEDGPPLAPGYFVSLMPVGAEFPKEPARRPEFCRLAKPPSMA